jgi:hypothetical protein
VELFACYDGTQLGGVGPSKNGQIYIRLVRFRKILSPESCGSHKARNMKFRDGEAARATTPQCIQLITILQFNMLELRCALFS